MKTPGKSIAVIASALKDTTTPPDKNNIDDILEDFANMAASMPEQHGQKILVNFNEIYDLVKKHNIVPTKPLINQTPMMIFLRDLITNTMMSEQQFNDSREALVKGRSNDLAVQTAIMEVTLRDRKTTLKHFCNCLLAERANVKLRV